MNTNLAHRNLDIASPYSNEANLVRNALLARGLETPLLPHQFERDESIVGSAMRSATSRARSGWISVMTASPKRRTESPRCTSTKYSAGSITSIFRKSP